MGEGNHHQNILYDFSIESKKKKLSGRVYSDFQHLGPSYASRLPRNKKKGRGLIREKIVLQSQGGFSDKL